MKMGTIVAVAMGLAVVASCAAQGSPAAAGVKGEQFDESGHVTVDGKSVPYLIRHLPVSSFPELPDAIQDELNRRGCLIPQTYEAHRPENVIHGSFEKRASSDWAVLCSHAGMVSLLVFFAGDADNPAILTGVAETSRLQPHGSSGALGFNWGIDTATPEQVREAQIGMEPHPARLDHDCIADSVIEGRAIYRYFAKGGWTLVETGN